MPNAATTINMSDVFGQFAEALAFHGLMVKGAPIPDGQEHKCATRNRPHKKDGAYVFHPDTLTGQIWDRAKSPNPIATWPPGGKAGQISEVDRERLEPNRRERENGAEIGRKIDLDEIIAESRIDEVNEITLDVEGIEAIKRLKASANRYGCSSGELNILRKNQYRRGRGGDEAAWLSMYGASSLRVDRKTGDRPIVYAPYAAVSITGSIQPKILQRCVAGQNTENGMFARLMLAWLPRRRRKLSSDKIDQDAERGVQDLYCRLTNLGYSTDEYNINNPTDLPLSDKAIEVFREWFNELAKRQQRATGARAAALSKIEGLAPRLALIIQLVSNSESTIISGEAMSAGVELARWQANETERIYALLGVGPSPADQETSELLAVIERLGSDVTTRQIQRASRRWRNRKEDLERALGRLIAGGIIRRFDVPTTEKGGQPSSRYTIVDGEPDGNDHETYGVCCGDGNTTPKNNEKMGVLSPPQPRFSNETEEGRL